MTKSRVIALILVACLAYWYIDGSVHSSYINERLGNATECYSDQITRYYCGPASAQIVFRYFNHTPLPAQEALAVDMGCSRVNEGTKGAVDIIAAFYNNHLRNYSGISGYTFAASLDNLKSNLRRDYPAIILTYFDDAHSSGHYMVVYGYNGSGIFVHDPWNSTKYNQYPSGRDGGPNVYLSNDKLAELWGYSGYWFFIIRSE